MSQSEIPYLKAWFMFFLVATIGGAICGFVLGFFVGFLMALAHADMTSVKVWCAVAGFIAGVPISFVTFRWSVRKFIVDPLEGVGSSDASLMSK